MSLNIYSLKAVETLDPICMVNNERTYGVLKGGKEITYQQFPATSVSNSQINITCNPPSNQVFINRKVKIKNEYKLEFTGPAPAVGNLLEIGVNDAPRAYPIATTLNSISLNMANDNITNNVNQFWNAMARYHNEHDKIECYSTTPSMLDQTQRYQDAIGSVRNPLSNYTDSSSMSDEPRGGFSGIEVVSNTATTAEVKLTCTEPVFISPLVFGKGNESGFIGFQNMQFTFTYGDLRRVWSHNPGGNSLTTLTVTLLSSTLLLNYLTPNLVNQIPAYISYPYYEVVPYTTRYSGSLAASASVIIPMNSVQLKSIPRRMYIFACNNPASYTTLSENISLTDTFCRINSLDIQFNNRTGVLSSASEQDLYEMSLRNGLDLSWSQWSKHVGSVACVQFGTDIGLDSNQAPGLLGNYQLGMRVGITNANTVDALAYLNLYVVVVYEGTFSITNGSCMHQVGVLSPQDILNSQRGYITRYHPSKHIYGGGFFDFLKDAGNVALQGAKAITSVVKPSTLLSLVPHPAAQAAANVLGAVGGRRKRRSRRKVSKKKGAGIRKRKASRKTSRKRGRGVTGGAYAGGELIGGRAMSRSMLGRRLKGSGLADEEISENEEVEDEYEDENENSDDINDDKIDELLQKYGNNEEENDSGSDNEEDVDGY